MTPSSPSCPDPFEDLPDRVFQDTQRLLGALESLFEQPQDALFAGIMSVAVMAHATGMPLDALLDGVSRAHGDLEPVGRGSVQ